MHPNEDPTASGTTIVHEQDFTYEFDYPGGGTLDVSGSGVLGGKPGVLIVDCITLVLLETHSDAKVETLRKEAPLRADMIPGKIGDDAFMAAPVRILIVNGMHADVYGLAQALPKEWMIYRKTLFTCTSVRITLSIIDD